MPELLARPCGHPGCGVLVRGSSRCPAHAKQARQQQDAQRGTSAQRGYGYRWQKASKGFLRAHPLCQCSDCLEGKKQYKPSQVVDHIIPHKGDMALFWDSANWQAMNKECHDRKTAREDGGFGNTQRVA